MQKHITIQVANARERQRSIISSAIKEIKHDRESGQPDIPGQNVRQDDLGGFVPDCDPNACLEYRYPALLELINSGDTITADGIPDGGNYVTPTRSQALKDVWFDNLPAEEGLHYTKVDESTITPATPLSPDTKVTMRFGKF